ncbi:hypothetical protein GCM10009836_31700 [Pseudonocardia ailaonensis]|uniref:Methyltransferase domain-containing protein n=1 Tax=Pseudonocardia ailaonensis TaxID=367279 RepID=A0ABN2N2T3_9PSEU
MADVAERVHRYILDGDDADLRRLLGIAEVSADMARDGFRRAGVAEGWRALDCGCGPIGGLAVLAELVGPTGRVVGVDIAPATVARARQVTAELGLDTVEVVDGDLHRLDADRLGGPFDVAFSRLFLMHQPDPVATLRRIGALLRPGGMLVLQEPVRAVPPAAHPPLAALGAYWALLHDVMESAGAAHDAAADLPRSAVAAGLEIVHQGGSFGVVSPETGLALHAGTVAAARARVAAAGGPVDRIDALAEEIRAADPSDHDWVSSPFFLDLLLRRPA